MKAFVSGVVAAIVIAVVVGVALSWLNWSSAEVHQSDNTVRLGYESPQ
jgi:hypothetical protein